MDQSVRQNWAKLSAVGMIESEQEINGKISIDRRYVSKRRVRPIE